TSISCRSSVSRRIHRTWKRSWSWVMTSAACAKNRRRPRFPCAASREIAIDGAAIACDKKPAFAGTHMKTLVALLLAVSVTDTFAETTLPSKELSFVNEVNTAGQRGLAWLLKQQEPDGSFRHHPAITALAATAVLRAGRPLTTEEQAATDKAIKFVLSCVK